MSERARDRKTVLAVGAGGLRRRLVHRFELLDHVASVWAIHTAGRQPLDRLWIGDSHAAFLASAPLQRFSMSAREAAVWLGPRLMYSIARDGFPDPLISELRKVRLPLAATPIVLVLGEIDCRVHLVEHLHRNDALGFAARYLERAAELRGRLGAGHAFVVAPIPPSDRGVDPAYPRNGTLQQRVAITRRLEETLSGAAAESNEPCVSVVRVADLLADARTGELAARFTDDGCHVNRRGSKLIRERLDSAWSERFP